ncbi:hypothetical protein GCM10010964_12990 [Caldovatus sediminis]|uniref:Uncharacterized protein n=1 Tax=Caldovatus sediminis TaxID=2041189 RepID=A0A8J2Z9Y0_9PROT|nr:hypothetical protein GCM10010964_12990 [Caldovatus sediminis]
MAPLPPPSRARRHGQPAAPSPLRAGPVTGRVAASRSAGPQPGEVRTVAAGPMPALFLTSPDRAIAAAAVPRTLAGRRQGPAPARAQMAAARPAQPAWLRSMSLITRSSWRSVAHCATTRQCGA